MKATLLWKRIPKDVVLTKSDINSELNRIWSLCRCLIDHDYAEAFKIFNNQKLQTWSSPQLTLLIEELKVKSKENVIDHVSIVYSSISLVKFAAMLGIGSDEATKLAFKNDWKLDETQTFLLPKAKSNSGNVTFIPNQTQMKQLTNLVSYLETQ
jgi:hypothetical protein